jgi:hypothetical protein
VTSPVADSGCSCAAGGSRRGRGRVRKAGKAGRQALSCFTSGRSDPLMARGVLFWLAGGFDKSLRGRLKRTDSVVELHSTRLSGEYVRRCEELI